MGYCCRCMEQLQGNIVCPHCGYDSRRMQDIPYALQPGTILGGKYLIGNVLGQGGFGITYIGRDLALEVKIAVKEYYVVESASRIGSQSQEVYWMNDPGNMNHFLTEARRMAMLEHMPQIAHVRDVFYANNTAYIIMEYVQGQTLKSYLQKNGTMSFERTVTLMLPVIRALGQVHGKGLIHRDISPDNLMMEPEGTLRVLDLGAAGDLNRNNGHASQLIARRGFSPYEQYVESGEIGPWTDVYAVCATIYYCCTGKVIPDAFARVDWYMQTKLSHLVMDPVIPPAGVEVLQQGLALEAADRICDMGTLAAQLEAALGIGSAPQKTKKKKEKKRSGIGRWLLACVLILLLAAAGFLISTRDSAEGAASRPGVPEESTGAVETESTAMTEEVQTSAPAAETTEEVPIMLEIAPSLEISDVELGHTEAVKILSGPSPDEITWSSSNLQVAGISAEGVLTAVGFGTTEITAEYADQKAVCTVTVTLRGNVECRYQSNRTGLTITGYKGVLSGDVVLPKEIDGQTVTEIGMEVFNRCTGLTSMTIPDSITVIPEGLFSGCTGLTSVTLPNSVEIIRGSAFKGCTGLTRITLPDSVKEIKEAAFSGCTGLTRLTIPHSVTTVGKGIFEGCTDLTSVVIGDGLIEIEDNAFYGCGKLTSVTFGASVAVIGKYAFGDCTSLSEITLPNCVNNIRVFAFDGCSGLRSVTIPESVEYIGAHAFGHCYSLQSVTVRKGCNYVENSFPLNCTVNFY